MRFSPLLLLASLPFLTGVAAMDDGGRTEIQNLESKTEVILAVQREAAMRDESLAAEGRKTSQEILAGQKEVLQKMDEFLKIPTPVFDVPDWGQDFSALKSGLLDTMIASGSGLLLFLILVEDVVHGVGHHLLLHVHHL